LLYLAYYHFAALVLVFSLFLKVASDISSAESGASHSKQRATNDETVVYTGCPRSRWNDELVIVGRSQVTAASTAHLRRPLGRSSVPFPFTDVRADCHRQSFIILFLETTSSVERQTPLATTE